MESPSTPAGSVPSLAAALRENVSLQRELEARLAAVRAQLAANRAMREEVTWRRDHFLASKLHALRQYSTLRNVRYLRGLRPARWKLPRMFEDDRSSAAVPPLVGRCAGLPMVPPQAGGEEDKGEGDEEGEEEGEEGLRRTKRKSSEYLAPLPIPRRVGDLEKLASRIMASANSTATGARPSVFCDLPGTIALAKVVSGFAARAGE